MPIRIQRQKNLSPFREGCRPTSRENVGFPWEWSGQAPVLPTNSCPHNKTSNWAEKTLSPVIAELVSYVLFCET